VTAAGRFITLEGGEGVGKSTQAKKLAAALKKCGIACVTTREPGGSPGAEEIRDLIVHGDKGRWDPLTETLLIFAARADHVARTIEPALSRNKWVICDRFTDSTFAYQGAGRGLARETIRRFDAIVLHDIRPDLTFILDLPVKVGLARTAKRAHGAKRFESFDTAFHERLRRAFLDIARREKQRCVVVDAEKKADDVFAAIWQVVAKRYKL
jgi:dTMP kinase